MTTLENLGKPIHEFRLSSGELFSIGDNACKDVDDRVALEVLKEFPGHGLKVISVTKTSKPVEKANSTDTEQKEPAIREEDDKFIKEMQQDVKFVCSVCAEVFPTDLKMRNHMKRSHE